MHGLLVGLLCVMAYILFRRYVRFAGFKLFNDEETWSLLYLG